MISVHGKCILAGEHAVVRGRKALVCPLNSRHLYLQPGKAEGPFQEALSLALKEAGRILGREIREHTVSSTIPPGAGLGSSAALSVAVAKLAQGEGDLFPLALQLENLFHGNASGLDVAAVLSQVPLLFQKGAAPQPLKPAWRPHLYLTDSGLRASTKACVAQVAALERSDLDERMEQAALAMEEALRAEGTESLRRFAAAMEEADSCFREWGLLPPELERQAQELKKQGALAVKPTGSGGGGFLLSLWEGPQEPGGERIPIWGS